MRSLPTLAPLGLALPLALIIPLAASAQTVVAPQPVTIGDVAGKPLDDLNLRKTPAEPALVAARANPYALPGKGRCTGVAREIAALDAVLGPDIDASLSPSARQKRDRAIAGAARSLVGGLIPFGSVVRQISGANAADENRALDIYAGSVRRAFLKGYARAKACRIRPLPRHTAHGGIIR